MARKPSVSAKRFIWTWQTSRSANEVAKKLKRSPASVMSRAYYYRKMGVGLKKFTRGNEPYDWHSLAEYADKCVGKDNVVFVEHKCAGE
jgi:hypothetical protein